MTIPVPKVRPTKTRDTEPIPGYRLIEPLGKGGFGEVWKCEAPGGLFKAIKFVSSRDDSALSNEPSNAEQELRALQHVKTIRHPFLLSMDRVEYIGGELVIVMELADRSLHDLLLECNTAGQSGIPRQDVLLYLREAAEVLDLMNQEYGLQHLDIKPRNLFLVHQHVKVADFGLVNSLAELNNRSPSECKLTAVTPLYASPEIFGGRVTLFSDQYSLAIVYYELITGRLPFAGNNFRQLALQHSTAAPDLSGVSAEDRAVVSRALSKEPRERFPSCTAFIRALIACTDPQGTAETRRDYTPVSAGAMQEGDRVDKDKTESIVGPTIALHAAPSAGKSDKAGEANSLDGFHFLDCLGRTPLGELWKVASPDGSARLVKLINTFSPAMGEENLASQLRAIHHRGLVHARVIPHTANRLAIVTPLVRETLASYVQSARESEKRGIPRLVLLRHLLTAAHTLDELQERHGLQHLGLNPRNLLLVEEQLKIADFGLMQLVWIPAGQQPAQINPRYCAPELFQRTISRSCDQYSLALIFYELLTGDQLHGSRTPSQLARLRSTPIDCLDLLSSTDRPAMMQALHPDAEQRYPSCVDFIRDLIENTPGGEDLLAENNWSGVEQEMELRGQTVQAIRTTICADRAAVEGLVGGILRDLTGDRELREHHTAPYYYRVGEEIEHCCYARLVPGTLRLKLSGFVEKWKAKLVEQQTDHFRFQMRLPSSLWRRVLGAQPALEIDIHTGAPTHPEATLTEVHLRIRTVDCSVEEASTALETLGPALIDSFRTHLQVGPERRRHMRLPFERVLSIRALLGSTRVGESMECRTKDISTSGMGIYLAVEPPPRLLVSLSRGMSESPMDVPARVVRTCPNGDGEFEVGIQFVLEE